VSLWLALITTHEHLFVLNTTHFVNRTLDNSEVVRLVGDLFNVYGPKFEQRNYSEPKTFMSHALSTRKTA
jgi:hypothetical protein